MTRWSPDRLRRRVAPLMSVLVLSLTGCGGGNTVAEITGSGSRQGDIEGFGSVVLGGEHFDTSTAMITIDGNPATEAQLQVGMKAELSLRPDRQRVIDRLSVNSRLVGRIDQSELSRRRIYLLGQEVRIDDRTVLDFADSAALQPGQSIAIFGSEVADGVLLACRIDDLAAGAADAVEEQINGPVSSVSGTELTIGDLTIDISVLPDRPALRSGDRVSITGTRNRAANPLRLEASELRLVPPQSFAVDETVVLGGVISNFAAQNNGSRGDFTMDGIPVRHMDGTDTIVGGSINGVSDGSRVVVEGFAIDQELVRGRVITFIPDVAAEVETRVTAVDINAGTLTIFNNITAELGVQSQFIAAADAPDRAYGLADIRVGDRIELRLSRVDLFRSRDQVLSDAELEIARVTAQTGSRPNELLVAPLEAVDEAGRRFVLLGQAFNINDLTRFDSHSSEADFYADVDVGDVLEVELRNNGGQLTALEISVDDGQLHHDSALDD